MLMIFDDYIDAKDGIAFIRFNNVVTTIFELQNKGGGHGEIGYHLAKELASRGHKVTLLQDAAAAGAVCLDGSPAGYYWRQGADPSKFLIVINGGGWCYGATETASHSRRRSGDPRHAEIFPLLRYDPDRPCVGSIDFQRCKSMP